MFFPDRDVVHQVLRTQVDDKVFLSVGEKEVDPGWSSVDMSRSRRIQELPDLDEGNQIKVWKMRLRTDETKPPARHTEASLLAAMEHAGKIVDEDSPNEQETEFGIGTPATRADIILGLYRCSAATPKLKQAEGTLKKTTSTFLYADTAIYSK